MRPSRAVSLLCLALLASGCQQDTAPAEPVEARQGLGGGSAETPAGVRLEVVFAASRGARLVLAGVRPTPLPPEITAPPSYLLRALGPDAASFSALPGDPSVQDAVVSLDGRTFAALLAGGRLLWRRGTAPWQELPGRALPNLALSPDGRRLAFGCGEGAPETDLCLVALDPPGTRRVVAAGPGPQGLPGFSADGGSLHYVAAPRGVAALWRLPLDGEAEPEQLSARGLAAEGIGSPRFTALPVGPRGVLHYAGALCYDAGEATVALHGERLRHLGPGGALPVPAAEPGRLLLLYLRDGELDQREVAP